MTTIAIRQIVEAFFRRWPFYAALLVGCLGVGVLAVFTSSDEYTSTGSVFVESESLVAAQSGVRESGFLSFLSPAEFTSQEMSGLISTEKFMESALDRAGVDLAAEPRLRRAQIDQMRASVSSFATSENLIAVSVTSPNPELSFRVANGIIEEFVRFQIDVDIAESGASEQFFAQLVNDYEEDLLEARDAVETALAGVSDLEALRPDRQLEIDRLQAAEAVADERYTSAIGNLEASRLATLQTETDVRQSYSVFDPPVVPVSPNGSLFDDLVLVAGAALLGMVLVLAMLIAVAALNRTVMFPGDVTVETSGAAIVAVLPRIPKEQTKLEGIEAPIAGSSAADGLDGIGHRTVTFVPEGGVDVDSLLPDEWRDADDPLAGRPAPTASGPEPVPDRDPEPEPAPVADADTEPAPDHGAHPPSAPKEAGVRAKVAPPGPPVDPTPADPAPPDVAPPTASPPMPPAPVAAADGNGSANPGAHDAGDDPDVTARLEDLLVTTELTDYPLPAPPAGEGGPPAAPGPPPPPGGRRTGKGRRRGQG